ncbi:MAG: hypothetical protein C0506_07595 [Anaerolinea sp.]|nr:hypothetical protein [Anaerolinea sp.]
MVTCACVGSSSRQRAVFAAIDIMRKVTARTMSTGSADFRALIVAARSISRIRSPTQTTVMTSPMRKRRISPCVVAALARHPSKDAIPGRFRQRAMGDTIGGMTSPSAVLGGAAAETGVDAVALTRGQRFVAIALVTLQVGLLLAMAATVATRLWQDHIWFGFALVGATVAVWLPELGRARARRWWFLYVAGIFAYTLLRAYADETFVPIRTMYVIHIDQAIFFGTNPVVWLQQRFFSPDRVTALDIFTVQVYWSFFIAPHLAGVLIFLWRRDLFPRYALLVVGTMYLGLVLFFVLPTTPPWLASQAGSLPQAFRVMDFVGGRVSADSYQAFYAALGEPNSVAAVPSIHMGVTFAMYLWARDHYPRLSPWLLAYSGLMGLSLIYLAEHYLADLVVGMACAMFAYWATKRLMPAQYAQPARAG